MESNLDLKCYMFYYENKNCEECTENIMAKELVNAKEIFRSSFKDNEIIKISEFPNVEEGSNPNVVYHRDCD